MGEAQIAQNLRHIARFEAKPYPRDLPPTAVTRGFERVAFPKIVTQLGSPNVTIRRKALVGICELLRSPICLVQCINKNAVKPLTVLLEDEDDLVRKRAADAIELVVVRALGCQVMVAEGTFAALVKCLSDRCPEIRNACYRAIMKGAVYQCAAECLVGMGTTLKLIMEHILKEERERCAMGLEVLATCSRMHRNEDALSQLIDDAGAVHALTKLLRTGRHWDIQEKAASLINLLAVRMDAKVELVNEGTVPHLLELLKQSRVSLDRASMAALGTITIANEGKQALVEAGGVESLLSKLSSRDEDVQRLTLICVTNVIENQQAQKELQKLGMVSFMKRMHSATESEDIKQRLAHAIRQLEFVHWPHELLLGASLPELIPE